MPLWCQLIQERMQPRNYKKYGNAKLPGDVRASLGPEYVQNSAACMHNLDAVIGMIRRDSEQGRSGTNKSLEELPFTWTCQEGPHAQWQ